MDAHQLQPHGKIDEAIKDLESLLDGEAAVERIILLGQRTIPYLERFLLDSPPRTVSIARCRAVRALGELGAYKALMQYFERRQQPADSAVLFAEDAVRSTVAQKLAQVHTDEVYAVLLKATRQRATCGLVQALGSFRRPESVPLLFELLEDDLCRTDAIRELERVPEAAQPYAVLLLRGCTSTPIQSSLASRRRRSTLQLLSKFGITARDWAEVAAYLRDEDLDCVIAAAHIGFAAAPVSAREQIIGALIDSSARMNWAQEMETIELLDEHRTVAEPVARTFAELRRDEGLTPNWLSPFWRTLNHILGNALQRKR